MFQYPTNVYYLHVYKFKQNCKCSIDQFSVKHYSFKHYSFNLIYDQSKHLSEYFTIHPLEKRRWLIASSSLPRNSRNFRTWIVVLKTTAINFICHGRWYHIYNLRNRGWWLYFPLFHTFYPLFNGIYKRKEWLHYFWWKSWHLNT